MSGKLITLEEIGRYLRDGMSLGVGGGPLLSAPAALIREVIRSGVGALRLIACSTGGYGIDLLIGAGRASSVEFAQISLYEYGFAPNFRRFAETGRLACLEHTWPGFLAGLQAGASGLPFMPVAGHVGSDYERLRPEFRVIRDPYDGNDVMVVPPIVPDVSLIHGLAADEAGNVLTEEKEDDFLLAPASRVVIASAEEIVSSDELRRMPYGLLVPGIHVAAVVHLPGGAHPTPVRGRYPLDEAHVLRYVDAARTDAAFAAYLDRYVFEPKSHAAYLDLAALAVDR